MTFSEAYSQTKEQVEHHLLDYIREIEDTKSKTIYSAMEYSLTAGGKRFRPILHLQTIRLLGGNPADFMDSACSLEYIHTYSLIHDDLPAMDNDDYRRGKPTNHKVFGEDMAILAGDGLLNAAYEILFRKITQTGSPAIAKGAAFIAKKAGTRGMVAGQVVDIQSEGQAIDLDTLNYIHDHKTAALIEASILSAAHMMNADPQQFAKLESYAKHLGMAFQISDDILDVEGQFELLGKPIGSDAQNQKVTFASFYGMEKAKEILKETVSNACCARKKWGIQAR